VRRVYVLNDGGHDYTDAERFGEIVFCTQGVVSKNDINKLFRQLDDTLSESGAKDLLVLTGPASLCAVASAIMASYHGEVHYLVFHDGQYYEKDLML
jgi:hypothetical protein